jgi:DNA-binding GntR family transcriptional regulator
MITRRLLREDVHAAVTDLILRGEVEPGARINESRLAERLGVSRTPLREALHRLEQEGFLRSEPNQGFIVHPLSEREVRDLYPVLWMLEGAALREAVSHGGVDLERIRRLDVERLAARDDLVREYDIDVEWHAELVRNCPNALLLDLIRHVKQIARRYLRLDIQRLDAAIAGHRAVIAALEAQDVDSAVDQVKRHWTHGMEATLSWVRELPHE